MTSPSNWFTSEIQQMMYGFGDSRRPSPETAALVEEIVHQHMVAMIHQASEVATMRGDKAISIEDILFLLRKDKVKLKRLLQYYEVQDLKNVVKSSLGGSEDPKLDVNMGLDKRAMGKNRRVCYEFLSSIDQTGELLALFDDREPDVVKHERLVRSELQARGMDTQQYMDFCQARQANFSRRYSKSQRFRDWLQLNLSPDIMLSATAIDIFSYLAYECVAQIVDLALLVKQDQRARPGDPTSRYHPPLSVNYAELQASSLYNKADTADHSQSPPYDSVTGTGSQLSAQLTGTQATVNLGNSQSSAANAQAVSAALGRAGLKKKRKRSGPATALEVSWDSTIMPSDVREAIRRYYTDIGPFASSMKVSPHCSPWFKTLCS
ncbi:transcription initiation protein SPT3 homolog [Aplysia californica]|uniref:Transcription initiation protein SPT3 homolog n=1 Tax=Aplysia californica TaxID=6500 RepID=A0ABM0JXS9_APLCA|nr:transcription initiation protein SPT3 homolog [Aplysia californica]